MSAARAASSAPADVLPSVATGPLVLPHPGSGPPGRRAGTSHRPHLAVDFFAADLVAVFLAAGFLAAGAFAPAPFLPAADLRRAGFFPSAASPWNASVTGRTASSTFATTFFVVRAAALAAPFAAPVTVSPTPADFFDLLL